MLTPMSGMFTTILSFSSLQHGTGGNHCLSSPRPYFVWRKRCHIALICYVMTCLIRLSYSEAQITLDGSLGTDGVLSGPRYEIEASVGRLRDGNLFHLW